MEEWEKLPNQVGSTKLQVPDVETIVHGAVKKSYVIGCAIVTVVALLWHFATPVRLTGGSTIAFFLALFTLWISAGWIIREISWTQRKYDADQYVNMCISFHVDLYCIFILFMIFTFFVLNDSCHQGPIGCFPTCVVSGDSDAHTGSAEFQVSRLAQRHQQMGPSLLETPPSLEGRVNHNMLRRKLKLLMLGAAAR